MSIVAGGHFGTLSVRVALVDTQRGRLGSGVADYPLYRKKEDPDCATQSHEDHMRTLGETTRKARGATQVAEEAVAALAIDTTGSSVGGRTPVAVGGLLPSLRHIAATVGGHR